MEELKSVSERGEGSLCEASLGTETHPTTKFGQAAFDNEENSVELTPVLLPAMFVRGIRGTYGALLDNCSTDIYIFNNIARRQELRCVRKVHLEVEGMCGEVL